MFRFWIFTGTVVEFTDTEFGIQELAENLKRMPLHEDEFIIYEG